MNKPDLEKLEKVCPEMFMKNRWGDLFLWNVGSKHEKRINAIVTTLLSQAAEIERLAEVEMSKLQNDEKPGSPRHEHALTSLKLLLQGRLLDVRNLCHKAAKKLEANVEGRDCMNADDMAELINELEGA